MQIKNNNNSNNSQMFGWHYRMHKDILHTATKGSTLGNGFINALADAVQKPDLDEFFLYGQKHFYYPNSGIKSFLDITGTHNAKTLYETHLKKFFTKFNPVEEAGRALHYLQDMTQPNHIERGSVLRKAIDARMHHNFEMQTYYNLPNLIENTQPIPIQASTFEELFEETIQLSQQNRIPNKANVNAWPEIAQQGFDLAVSITQKFIELMQKRG